MSQKQDIDQRLFQRIEDYLSDRMDAEERTAFEVKLKAEPDLAEEVDLQRLLRDSIEVGGMKEELDELHERLFAQESKSGPFMPTAWKAAAGVLIILGVGAALMNWESKEDVLFGEYATIDPGTPVPMGSTDKYEYYDAMVDYKAKKYQSAIDKWSVLSSAEPANDTLTYYIHAALFNQEKYRMAIEGLLPLAASDRSTFRHRAQWYILLSHLALRDEDAIHLAVIDTDSPYAGRAESLRSELR